MMEMMMMMMMKKKMMMMMMNNWWWWWWSWWWWWWCWRWWWWWWWWWRWWRWWWWWWWWWSLWRRWLCERRGCEVLASCGRCCEERGLAHFLSCLSFSTVYRIAVLQNPLTAVSHGSHQNLHTSWFWKVAPWTSCKFGREGPSCMEGPGIKSIIGAI